MSHWLKQLEGVGGGFGGGGGGGGDCKHKKKSYILRTQAFKNILEYKKIYMFEHIFPYNVGLRWQSVILLLTSFLCNIKNSSVSKVYQLSFAFFGN